MKHLFSALIIKEFQLMIAGRFLLLFFVSLLLYSCYINFIYVRIDQDAYPVYLYDPEGRLTVHSSELLFLDQQEQLQEKLKDGYGIAIDASGEAVTFMLVSSGSGKTDSYRAAYAESLLAGTHDKQAIRIGAFTKESKSRREITCEFLFFELTAVGFLGIASLLFKEKKMGMFRLHSILPVRTVSIVLSKVFLFLVADLLFAVFFTLINLGFYDGLSVLPGLLLQVLILSLIMSLAGFCCALILSDFKQFSLFYLVLATFITTPVFLAGQTGLDWGFIQYHPMYHLFLALKGACFQTLSLSVFYFPVWICVIGILATLACRLLHREMTKGGTL